MTRPPQTPDVITTVLNAAGDLAPTPSYINGDEYSQWYVEAEPALLRALAQLALAQGSDELAARLERLSHPLCMEPLDPVLMPGTMPQRWCGTPVQRDGVPCEAHVPERAAELGRCTYVNPAGERAAFTRRICRGAPVEGSDRCEVHAARCRAVKRDKKVCNRVKCTIPQHQ
ncbi:MULTISPECIES: hypothetical protein [unclassified Streptomyces]|uniref:hypothetical protein n=1 Tax=unclassified Streptomyces TaxID=2593676 RepID=UPI000DABA1B2|nr:MULTISPECIES: hypothetical protein [unclassified Streptomyces]PZT71795.1 hypothetical protein DNK55_32220 [Streptomyces sp. AC1-42T]PZT73080.1 hypothetical protein DNK56_32855 [Streptomyces sp. AC1-42W]